VKGGTLRKADPRVVTPFHLRLMQLIADAGPRYGASNLRLQGGTALAAYHLQHRESEDLDFFADSPIDARDWGKFVQAHVADAGIELTPMVREAFSALLTDAMECDPGIGPEYAGQEISRGQNRPIVSAFRLRVLRKIEEADIQRTLRICLAECARRAEVSL
jgi:hypothetical protein